MSITLSIIIPYYKGENYIEILLKSIVSAWNNSNKNIIYEVVIIVDSIGNEYNIRNLANKYENVNLYFNKKNIGIAETRNFGIAVSKYKYLYFIDQDDSVKLNFFNIIQYNFNHEKALNIYNGDIIYKNKKSSDSIFYKNQKFNFKTIIFQQCGIVTTSLIIVNKSKIMGKVRFGGLCSMNSGCDDWSFYLELSLLFDENEFNYINQKIVNYVKHDKNFSNNRDKMILGSIDVLNFLKKKYILNTKYRKYCLLMEKYFEYEIIKLNKFKKFDIKIIKMIINSLKIKITRYDSMIRYIKKLSN